MVITWPMNASAQHIPFLPYTSHVHELPHAFVCCPDLETKPPLHASRLTAQVPSITMQATWGSSSQRAIPRAMNAPAMHASPQVHGTTTAPVFQPGATIAPVYQRPSPPNMTNSSCQSRPHLLHLELPCALLQLHYFLCSCTKPKIQHADGCRLHTQQLAPRLLRFHARDRQSLDWSNVSRFCSAVHGKAPAVPTHLSPCSYIILLCGSLPRLLIHAHLHTIKGA